MDAISSPLTHDVSRFQFCLFLSYKFSLKKNTFSGGLWKCVGKLPDAHDSVIYSIHCAPSRAGHGRIVSAGADGRVMIFREALGSTSDKPIFAKEIAVQVPQGEVNHVC